MNFYTLAIGDPKGVWRLWDGVRKWDRAGHFFPLALRQWDSPELRVMKEKGTLAVWTLSQLGRGDGDLRVVPIPFAGPVP